MTALFHKKHLSCPDRVCIRLKHARKTAGVTLKELSVRTKISSTYLKALEECRFTELKAPSMYQKQFVKRYLEALNLDPAPFLEQFWEEEVKYTSHKTVHPKINYKRWHLSDLPNVARYLATAGAVFAVLIYMGIQVVNTLQAPPLTLVSPEDGFITQEKTIAIKGHTDPEIKVDVNGENIMNDERGAFNQIVTLTPGVNTIVVTAKNKHGKITEETRRVIYKTNPQFSLIHTN